MAASRQQLELALLQLGDRLAAIRERLAAVTSQLDGPVALTPQERQNLQNQQQQLANTVEALNAEIDVARSALQQADAPGVVPLPPATAGQTVSDDSLPNPIKRAPLEVDNVSGRVNPFPTTTSGSNAILPKTLAQDEGDFGLDQTRVSLEATQTTLIPPAVGYLAPIGRSLPPGGAQITPVVPGTSIGTTVPAVAQQPGGAQAPAVPATVAREDTPAVNPASTTVTVNNGYNNQQPVQPQPNVLDNFASYTYSVSVYLLTPEQYKTMANTQRKSVAGFTLLFQSAGAPVGTNATGANRSAFFSDDFYIDTCSVTNMLPGKQTRASHMVSDIKFTVVEPNGITMLDRLFGAVQAVIPKTGGGGNINYAAAPYLMVIRWYGWDLNGELIKNLGAAAGNSDPNAAVEKFVPFLIKKINWGVSNKLVTYDWECAPMGQMGASTNRGTIPYDIELTEQTIKGILTGDSVTTTTVGSGATPAASGTTSTTPAPSKANSAPTPRTVIKQGLMATLNDFQNKLVEDGIYEQADQYELVFANGAEDIRDAVIILPGKIKNLSTTGMPPPVTRDPSSADPKRTSVDNTTRNLSVTAGQPIVQVLDMAIRNSSYIYRQARVTNSEETGDDDSQDPESPSNPAVTQNIRWFEISMQATPLLYDYKRNDYAYKITFIISPYVVPNFDSKYFPLPKFNGIHKRYTYWFTGENTSVLDYNVTFNHLYALTMSGTDQVNSATNNIRRLYTSSLREVPKYTYQSRSTESSMGAEGKGNEISANAAEYLYSPTDLAEIKLRIVGDPAWIQQGSQGLGISAGSFNYNAFLPDGTINFDSSQVLFAIEWQRPVDYDLNTGLADPYENVNGQRQPIQSYTYMAKKCISEFRQGRFEQTIEGALYQFPTGNSTAVSANRASTVGAATAGTAIQNVGNANNLTGTSVPSTNANPALNTGEQGLRTSTVSNTGLVVPTGQGPVPSQPNLDVVNLQTQADPAIVEAQPTLSRQQVSPVTSNGVTVGVNLPAPPPAAGVTKEPTQQIVVST